MKNKKRFNFALTFRRQKNIIPAVCSLSRLSFYISLQLQLTSRPALMDWKWVQLLTLCYKMNVIKKDRKKTPAKATRFITELLLVTKCVELAEVARKKTARHCLELRLHSAATFEPIQLYIICLTANQQCKMKDWHAASLFLSRPSLIEYSMRALCSACLFQCAQNTPF